MCASAGAIYDDDCRKIKTKEIFRPPINWRQTKSPKHQNKYVIFQWKYRPQQTPQKSACKHTAVVNFSQKNVALISCFSSMSSRPRNRGRCRAESACDSTNFTIDDPIVANQWHRFVTFTRGISPTPKRCISIRSFQAIHMKNLPSIGIE